MVLTKQEKIEQVTRLTDQLKNVASAVMLDFRGLDIAQLNELRDSLREQGIGVAVVKTTLLARALKNAGYALPEAILGQPIALITTQGDELAIYKLVAKFVKDYEQAQMLAGIFEGVTVDAEIAAQLAALPGKAELQVRLVGTLSNIPRRLISALRWSGFALTSVLNQYAQTKSN